MSNIFLSVFVTRKPLTLLYTPIFPSDFIFTTFPLNFKETPQFLRIDLESDLCFEKMSSTQANSIGRGPDYRAVQKKLTRFFGYVPTRKEHECGTTRGAIVRIK